MKTEEIIINTISDVYKYFDDVVEDEYSVWSQVCPTCLQKFIVVEHASDEELPIDGLICGVEGCNNEATHYIDFHPIDYASESYMIH